MSLVTDDVKRGIKQLRFIEDRFLNGTLDPVAVRRPLQDIIEQAHKIKGAARIVQATPLAGQCETLEQACVRGDDWALIETGAKALESLMLELERLLQGQLHGLEGQ